MWKIADTLPMRDDNNGSVNLNWHSRLQFRVSVLLIILVTAVMLSFSIYGAMNVNSELQHKLENYLDIVTLRISRSVASAVWDMDQENLTLALEAELLDERVHTLQVRDIDGMLLAFLTRDSQGSVVAYETTDQPVGQLLQKQSEITFENEVIATINVYVDKSFKNLALKTYYRNQSLQTIFLIIILVVAVGVALRAMLIKPLANLTVAAESVSQNKFDIDIDTSSRDEVGRLAKALEVFRQNALEKIRLQEQQEKASKIQREQAAENQRMGSKRREAEERLRQEQIDVAARESEQARELQLRADQLLQIVDAAASGDLSQRLSLKGDDIIGQIAAQLDTLFERLRGSLGSIDGSAIALGKASNTLTTISSDMSGNAEETSSRAALVTEAASNISGGVENVAVAVDQMRLTIKGIADNAVQATTVATEAATITESTNEVVKNLANSSTGIGEVIKVITSIAEQTNLLALNATIEAARAGDAGKGFAVVANEVKELAKETAKATQEISERIAAIQSDSHSVTDSIGGISQIIGRINELQSVIAGSVDEQANATAEISRSVVEAARGSGDITGSITAVAKAAKGTLENAQNAQNAAFELDEMAARINAQLTQFKL